MPIQRPWTARSAEGARWSDSVSGLVEIGAGTPEFAPFITPRYTIGAFAVGTESATPVAATPVA